MDVSLLRVSRYRPAPRGVKFNLELPITRNEDAEEVAPVLYIDVFRVLSE